MLKKVVYARSTCQKSQERTEEVQDKDEKVEGESERQSDQPQGFEVKGHGGDDVASEVVPPERSMARGQCRARRHGKVEPSATVVAGGIYLNGFKGQAKRGDLAEIRLEMEVISQCGSAGLDDYKPSGKNMAKMKLVGQLDVVEYSCIRLPESVHMGDLAGGYLEMVKASTPREGT